MEEEKELKPEEAVKVKEIRLIKPAFTGQRDYEKWILKLKTDTGEERIVKLWHGDFIKIRGDLKIDWGLLSSPEHISFTFEEPVLALFYEGNLLMGDFAEGTRRYLEREQKKLKEAI